MDGFRRSVRGRVPGSLTAVPENQLEQKSRYEEGNCKKRREVAQTVPKPRDTKIARTRQELVQREGR